MCADEGRSPPGSPSASDSQTAGTVSPEDLEAYRQAVEHHAIVAITDRRGRILYVNDLFCRISGYSRGELIGKTHRIVNSGHHGAEFWREVWSTITAGRIWRGEICNRARDGSIYWVDSTLVPLIAENGQARGYMAVRHPITALKRAHDRQRSLERRDLLRESVLNSVSYAVIGTGPDRKITMFNRGAENLLGYKAEELIGILPVDAVCDPDELMGRAPELERLRHEPSNAALEREWTYVRKDGARVPVFVSLTALRDVQGHFLGYLGVAHDISARLQAEEALRESERKFRSLYEAAPLMIMRTSIADGRVLEGNPQFHALTGYAPEDLPKLRVEDVTPSMLEHESRRTSNLWQTGAYGPIERECRRKDGSRFPVLMNGMRSGEGDAGRFVWSIAQDISKRKQMESELRQAAHMDKLTGLANRARLSEQLGDCIRRGRQNPGLQFALLYLDLDYFKTINDSLGHGAGDRVLQEIAERLRTTLRESDTVARPVNPPAARLGGDEFVVLLDDIGSVDSAVRVAARLLRALSAPYDVLGRQFNLSTSIGIVMSDGEHPSVEAYLRDADTAMYEAKRAGRGRFAIFDARMRERVQRGLLIQSELRGALQHGQFHLVYQPVVCMDSGRLHGCEALLRWRHPKLGLVPPSEFIPIAEETGVILDLGDWVLRTACAQFACWRARYGVRAPESVSVNISRAQLVVGNFEQSVRDVLRACAIEPRQVHLEITETAVMKDPAVALRIMRALRELGVKLDLDDFGTGYSSLGSIHDFPIDVIKIDRSFVHGLESSGRVSAVIEAVARLAHHLSLEVVAEGIETSHQRELLRKLGCRFGQGYLFGRPVDARRFADALARPGAIGREASALTLGVAG
jgi:diguanylate cyclase (GGDEF)-like protein/PAS domain S-box-containing protein